MRIAPLVPCCDCDGPPACPMIEDGLWRAVSEGAPFLCLDCFEKRLGRRIILGELRPCLLTTTILQMIARSYDVPATDEESNEARDAASLFGIGRALDRFMQARRDATMKIIERSRDEQT